MKTNTDEINHVPVPLLNVSIQLNCLLRRRAKLLTQPDLASVVRHKDPRHNLDLANSIDLAPRDPRYLVGLVDAIEGHHIHTRMEGVLYCIHILLRVCKYYLLLATLAILS
eukprot:CAMPEP_0118640340 /NCGR_PEP_ID=MMETSP0785-20121206/4702_1 /TAXON_ID=91992 /ORGANISM="Bolidomonas pacifica, Strain CCMP 1866" /LENGTH=110 /DNA_ID=CAMNT_0006531723 /DNA_START=89 /DNA_END=418 /DNA_ORIENTATION=-